MLTSFRRMAHAIYPTCFSAYLQECNRCERTRLSSERRSLGGYCIVCAQVRRLRASLLCWDEVSGLLMPKFHLIAEHVDVQQLPHILFPIVL